MPEKEKQATQDSPLDARAPTRSRLSRRVFATLRLFVRKFEAERVFHLSCDALMDSMKCGVISSMSIMPLHTSFWNSTSSALFHLAVFSDDPATLGILCDNEMKGARCSRLETLGFAHHNTHARIEREC